MFDKIYGWFDQINIFYQWIWDFFTTGIYEYFREAMVIATKASLHSFINMQMFALDVAFEAANSIVADLSIVNDIQSAYSSLGTDVLSTLAFFGIPQCLNILFAALSTRFVLRFVPFIGR